MKNPSTPSRKRDHVELTVKKDVAFRSKSAGFEEWEFVHNALPEIDLSEIDTTSTFLGRTVALPLMVSCMTGGYAEAERINRQLAEVCEEFHIAMGVGSQRQAMENSTYHRSFSVVRKTAPSVPVVGNIGAPEIAGLKDVSPLLKLAELIGADGFAVHVNPLQEFLQPEGNTNFRGVLNGIELLVKTMPVPIIVKEIGAGISRSVAERLVNVGVQYIDVAGAGGTSWAGVEILRKKKDEQSDWDPFWDWGIRTADALVDLQPLRKNMPGLTVIASGGIVNGLDAAKAIALGSEMTAAARPLLRALMNGGRKELRKKIEQWQREFRGTMFLTGSATLQQLKQTSMLHRRQ